MLGLTARAPDRPPSRPLTAPDLDLRQEHAVVADVHLDVELTVSGLHQAFFETERARELLLEGVRDLVAGQTPAEARETLREAGITALDGFYATLCTQAAGGDERAVWELLSLTRKLGTGQDHFNLRSGRGDISSGAVALFASSAVTPHLSIRLGGDFFERRRAQREDVLRFLLELSEGARVTIAASGLVEGRLWREHRDLLPASVTERVRARLRSADDGDADLVERALGELDPDGRHASVLSRLAEEPSELLTYGRLQDMESVGRSYVRKLKSELSDLGLVEGVQHADEPALMLTPAGRDYVDALDQYRTDQAVLPDFGGCVTETPKSRDEPVYHTREDGRGEGSERSPYSSLARYMSQVEHVTAVSGAEDGGVGLVDHPIRPDEDARQPAWSCNDARDELVVGAQYQNALQWWVCIALALSDPKTWDRVATPGRLDAEDDDLAGLEVADCEILRNGRGLGYLKSDEANGENYRDRLLDARDELEKLTRTYYERFIVGDGDEDDRKEFRATILRNAHGLAGTMLHLLDLLGVDIIRVAWLPDFKRAVRDERREDFLKTLAIGASIQSRYGHFNIYKQVFEDRPQKRHQAITPDVDAADPFGELIGSFVLVGDGVDVIKNDLARAFRRPKEVHEDAPEISVRVGVTTGGAARYWRAVRRMLDFRKLEATREATRMLRAFTGSIFDVAMALRGLSKEDYREIRIDEVRYALSTLPEDRILPRMRPTVRAIVHTLLGAHEPIRQTELCRRAEVSGQSFRNNREVLEALDVVREEGGKWRIALSLPEERGRGIVPWYVQPDRERDDDRDGRPLGVLAEVAIEGDLPNSSAAYDAINDLWGAAYGALHEPQNARKRLSTAWKWAPRWLRFLREANGELAQIYRDLEATPSWEPERIVVEVGPRIEQESIQAAVGREANARSVTTAARRSRRGYSGSGASKSAAR